MIGPFFLRKPIGFSLVGLWIFLTPVSSFSQSPTQSCSKVFDSRRLHLLADNRFNVSRDLYDYLMRFGPHFQLRIKDLQAGQIWIDVGAGQAFAQKDYIRLRQNPATAKTNWNADLGRWDFAGQILHQRFFFTQAWPQLIAVSYVKPKNFQIEPGLPLDYRELNWSVDHHQFDHLTHQVDILTDYYGNLSYTEKFSEDLTSYLRLLKPQGKIYVSLDKSITEVVLRDGRRVDILTWLKGVPGLAIHPVWTIESLTQKLGDDAIGFWDGDSFEISLQPGFDPSQIPQLHLQTISVYDSGPPRRIFTETPP